MPVELLSVARSEMIGQLICCFAFQTEILNVVGLYVEQSLFHHDDQAFPFFAFLTRIFLQPCRWSTFQPSSLVVHI